MAAAAHNPAFAKKAGIPVSVAKEFNAADKGKKFKSGGDVANLKKLFKGKESYSEELKEGKAIKSGKISPEQYAKGEEMEKKMGKGGCCKMAKGGSIKEARMEPAKMEKIPQGNKKFGQHAIQKKGLTKGKNLGDSGKTDKIEGFKPKKFAAGGNVSADDLARQSVENARKNGTASQLPVKKAKGGAIDGIAQRGKTKGRYI